PAGADRARMRLLGSDALRVVAVVGVVMIHASAWGPGRDFSGIQLVSRYSVPAFMVLTGVVLAYQYAGRPLGQHFVRRRVSRTLLPWLVWMPVYLAFNILVTRGVHADAGSVYTFLNQGAGHLWYLLLIPQLYLLFAAWPERHPWLLVLPSLALQTALVIIRVYGPLPDQLLREVVLVHGFLLFPFWIGYFAIGVAIGRGASPRLRTQRHGLLMAVAIIDVAASGYLLLNVDFSHAQYGEFLSGSGAFLNPVLPLFTITVIILVLTAAPPLLRMSSRVAGGLRSLSDLSLGIYILHPIPLHFLGLHLRDPISSGTPFAFLPFIAIVLGSLIAAAIATRLIAATPLAVTVGLEVRPLRAGAA
ncbi:MAG TPA: acyltransferase, partial [Candidatus Dormibacteraeota bacterium]|nr:acyltransferase [Candidatus Dormibacteraeota bacterium]